MTNPLNIDDHSFCRFARQFCSIPNGKLLLNHLEQKIGANPNILLLCVWLAKSGFKPILKREVKSLINNSTPWHDKIVLALQKVANLLLQKENSKLQLKLADEIKVKLQLAEHLEQLILVDAILLPPYARSAKQQVIDACKNINTYFTEALLSLNDDINDKIQQLLMITFADAEPAQIVTTWQSQQNKQRKKLEFTQLDLDEIV